jgi:hypothetical protein
MTIPIDYLWGIGFARQQGGGSEATKDEANIRIRDIIIDPEDTNFGIFEDGWLVPYSMARVKNHVKTDLEAKVVLDDLRPNLSGKTRTSAQVIKRLFEQPDTIPDERKARRTIGNRSAGEFISGIQLSDYLTIYDLRTVHSDDRAVLEKFSIDDLFDHVARSEEARLIADEMMHGGDLGGYDEGKHGVRRRGQIDDDTAASILTNFRRPSAVDLNQSFSEWDSMIDEVVEQPSESDNEYFYAEDRV